MNLGPFSFEVVARGILSAQSNPAKRTWIVDRDTYNEWNPSKWMAKNTSTADKYGADGKPLTPQEAERALMWRTTNSFTGRCGLAEENAIASPELEQSDTRRVEISAAIPKWLSRSSSAYRQWSLQLYLRSSAELPSILLSVAPYYFPYTAELHFAGPLRGAVKPYPPLPSTPEERFGFDRKMLQTPLIWEEPYCFSVEVNKDGLFLWSETWEVYGKKIGDHGMRSREQLLRFGEIAAILQRSMDFETLPDLLETPTFEGYVKLDWSSEKGENCREAQLTISVGELHERSGVYEYAVVTERAENTTSGSSSGEDSEAEPERNRFTIVPHLQFEWKVVHTHPLRIPSEATNALFTPYVTLVASGDAAAIVGGSKECIVKRSSESA